MSDCICFTNEAGAKVRVLLCPEHGDAKATGPKRKEDRTPASSLRRTKGLEPGKGPKPVSDTEAIRKAYLAGVKDKTIAAMVDGGENVWCELCETDIVIRDQTLDPEEMRQDLFARARKKGVLHLHHQDVRRAEAKGYRKNGDPGSDNPLGLLLLCPPCHDKLEKDRK